MRRILVGWLVLGWAAGCAWIVDPDPATYSDAATPTGDACAGEDCSGVPICTAPTPPGDVDCPSICNGGCASGVCTIDCIAVSCEGQTIECPPSFECVVNCVGTDACDTGSVNCGESVACTLNCGPGSDACGDLDLNCGIAGPCRMTCVDGSCSGANVNCSRGGDCQAMCTGSPVPSVNCAVDSECACTPC